MTSRYLRRRYVVPGRWLDLFSAAVATPELLGLERRSDEVVAYYPRGARPAALPGHWEGRVRLVAEDEILEEDWLRSYRSQAQPEPLGRGFWVDPREPEGDIVPPPGRQLLRLPARRAFGTGSHPSTRLAVVWLEALATQLVGAWVLDVGSGSGVLGFVAERLGAGVVVGVEVEPEAALIAAANRELNDSRIWLVGGSVEGIDPDRRFDVVVANILAARLLPILPELATRLVDGGRLVLSGALAADEADLAAAALDCGLSVRGREVDGEWVALHLSADLP